MPSRPQFDVTSARHVVEIVETTGRLIDRRVECDLAPVWVDGDQTRIEQILTNLLINAATYTAAGGRIFVRTAREDATAVMEVNDDGQGIEPEKLLRVFDLFFQGEATADRSSGGLGIGLTLVQRLAALHGGDVNASSGGGGQGATFTVRLPALAVPPTDGVSRPLDMMAASPRGVHATSS